MSDGCGKDRLYTRDEIMAERAEISRLTAELAAAKREHDNWQSTAEQESRNTQYYRGLVVQIGEQFGVAAKTQDDGGIVEDVLCAKVPELVVAMRRGRDEFAAALNFAVEELRRMGYTGALLDPSAILATRDAAIRKPLEEERDALRDDYEQLRSIPKVNTLEPHWRCAVCGLVAMPLTDDSTCNCSDPDEDEHWERIDPPAILAAHDAAVRKPPEEEKAALAAALAPFREWWLKYGQETKYEQFAPFRDGLDPAAILATVRAKARAEGIRKAAIIFGLMDDDSKLWHPHQVRDELDRLADAEEAGKGDADEHL